LKTPFHPTPQPITKKFVTVDYVGDPYSCAKLGAHVSTGTSGHMGEIKPKLFLFIPFLWELTYRSEPSTDFQVRPVEGFSCMMAQTMRTRARCAFLGFVYMAPHLGVKTQK